MKVVGKTESEQLVVAGVGEMYFQEGIPLSIIFDGLKRRNLIPSWLHLYNELKINGMSRDRILHLLSEHVFESYGKEFRDHVITKLESIG